MKVHRSRSVRRAKVIPDGKNLVSHAGAALLAELADRSGLTEAMSLAMADCGINWHTHDPGVVLTHLGVAIADGADCLADVAALKEQEELFGPVASVATAWRAVHATTAVELRAIPVALAAGRERVWSAEPPVGPMIWDFDSTLLNVFSEKEDAAPTYKHGFGFNPFAVWCDNTNETLAAMLRPGNAAPGDTDDHLELLEQAVRAVPAEYALGHEEGDDPALVVHPILVRADSAGASHRFVSSLSDANFDYSIGFPISGSVRDALLLAQEEDWVRANELDGGIREGAEVIELTELYEVKGWPETCGSSLGASARTQAPSSRSSTPAPAGGTPASSPTPTGTTSPPSSCATAATPASRTGCVAGRPADWPTCPSRASAPTRPGWRSHLIAGALLAWSQMTCFDGALAKAEPKTMRYRVLHVAAILVHRGRDLILRPRRDLALGQ